MNLLRECRESGAAVRSGSKVLASSQNGSKAFLALVDLVGVLQ